MTAPPDWRTIAVRVEEERARRVDQERALADVEASALASNIMTIAARVESVAEPRTPAQAVAGLCDWCQKPSPLTTCEDCRAAQEDQGLQGLADRIPEPTSGYACCVSCGERESYEERLLTSGKVGSLLCVDCYHRAGEENLETIARLYAQIDKIKADPLRNLLARPTVIAADETCSSCNREESEVGLLRGSGSSGMVALCWECYHRAGEESLGTIARLQREVLDLRGERDAVHRGAESSLKALETMVVEREQLRSERNHLRAERDQLCADREQLVRQIEILESCNKGHADAIARLHAQIDEIKAEHAAGIERLAAAHTGADLDAIEAREEAARLRAEVERLTPVRGPEPSEEDKNDFSSWVKALVTIDPIVDYLRACHVQELPEELARLVMAWRSKPPTEAAQTCLQCEADASACTCVDGPRTVSR